MTADNSIRRYIYVVRPEEVLPEKQMSTYAEILRRVLRASGINVAGSSQTPDITLRDGTVVSVHGDDRQAARLDTYELSPESNTPEASVWASSVYRPDESYLMTYRPIIMYGGRIFVHSLVARDLYRLATTEDDQVLAPVFSDIEATL